jgi:hypothetical protein
MDSPPPALILARHRRALTGSSRGLSQAYNKGDLVSVRAGGYYNKPRGSPSSRGNAIQTRRRPPDPSVNFCYLTALRIWRLPSPRGPDHIHMLTSSPPKAGRLPPTTLAARDPKTGFTGLEAAKGHGVSRHH